MMTTAMGACENGHGHHGHSHALLYDDDDTNKSHSIKQKIRVFHATPNSYLNHIHHNFHVALGEGASLVSPIFIPRSAGMKHANRRKEKFFSIRRKSEQANLPFGLRKYLPISVDYMKQKGAIAHTRIRIYTQTHTYTLLRVRGIFVYSREFCVCLYAFQFTRRRTSGNWEFVFFDFMLHLTIYVWLHSIGTNESDSKQHTSHMRVSICLIENSERAKKKNKTKITKKEVMAIFPLNFGAIRVSRTP